VPFGGLNYKFYILRGFSPQKLTFLGANRHLRLKEQTNWIWYCGPVDRDIDAKFGTGIARDVPNGVTWPNSTRRKISRWRTPPSWIYILCNISITGWAIVTKFCMANRQWPNADGHVTEIDLICNSKMADATSLNFDCEPQLCHGLRNRRECWYVVSDAAIINFGIELHNQVVDRTCFKEYVINYVKVWLFFHSWHYAHSTFVRKIQISD